MALAPGELCCHISKVRPALSPPPALEGGPRGPRGWWEVGGEKEAVWLARATTEPVTAMIIQGAAQLARVCLSVRPQSFGIYRSVNKIVHILTVKMQV